VPPPNGSSHLTISFDMASDDNIARFADFLGEHQVEIDGAILMPPQPHSDSDPMPESETWRKLFQTSFIGPLATLKVAIERMRPNPDNGKRCKIVIISGISSAQVLSHYATSNVIRTAWIGEAKTLAFALGPRGIHINTLSLGGTLAPWYRASIEKRAEQSGMSYDKRIEIETDNVPLRKYGEPKEVAAAVEGLLSSFSDHMTGLNILHDGGFTRAY